MEREWDYQITFLSSIQAICTALAMVQSLDRLLLLSHTILIFQVQLIGTKALPSKSRLYLNFRRRYKWLFASSHRAPSEPLIDIPPLSQYIEDIEDASNVSCLRSYSAANGFSLVKLQQLASRSQFTLAEGISSRLVTMQAQRLCGEEEAKMRTEVCSFRAFECSCVIVLTKRLSLRKVSLTSARSCYSMLTKEDRTAHFVGIPVIILGSLMCKLNRSDESVKCMSMYIL